MPSILPMPGPLAAVVGALAAWVGVTVTVLMFLWNKLDKQFDELKAELREYRAEVKADMREHRSDTGVPMVGGAFRGKVAHASRCAKIRGKLPPTQHDPEPTVFLTI